MKKVIVIVTMVMLGFSIQAQDVFNKGSLMFNAGIGAPYSGYGLYSYY